MKPTRRNLFGLLAAAALDPERLLWTPGRKLISIPKPTVLTLDDDFRRMILTLHEEYIQTVARELAARIDEEQTRYLSSGICRGLGYWKIPS